MKTLKEMLELPLNEWYSNHYLDILRVPGGWIYVVKGIHGLSTFVPEPVETEISVLKQPTEIKGFWKEATDILSNTPANPDAIIKEEPEFKDDDLQVDDEPLIGSSTYSQRLRRELNALGSRSWNNDNFNAVLDLMIDSHLSYQYAHRELSIHDVLHLLEDKLSAELKMKLGLL